MTLPLFPSLPGITWPAKRSPQFSTQIQSGISGRRTPIRYQLEPRWAYELIVEFARDRTGFTEFSDLVNLYLVCYGRFGTFRFSDPRDNAVTAQLIGVGDGATTKFFLSRNAFGFSQRVAALNGTPTIFVAGIPAVGYTIDAYGVITFSVAPTSGQAVTWTGAYHWICRFSDDQLDLSQFMDKWWECKSLKFETELIF